MPEKDPRSSARPEDLEPEDELVLWWRNPDGSLANGRALPRHNAEELALIFSKMYPDQTYWLEPLKATPRGSYVGLRRKPGRRKGASKPDV
jgi:hypothetical protein